MFKSGTLSLVLERHPPRQKRSKNPNPTLASPPHPPRPHHLRVIRIRPMDPHHRSPLSLLLTPRRMKAREPLWNTLIRESTPPRTLQYDEPFEIKISKQQKKATIAHVTSLVLFYREQMQTYRHWITIQDAIESHPCKSSRELLHQQFPNLDWYNYRYELEQTQQLLSRVETCYTLWKSLT